MFFKELLKPFNKSTGNIGLPIMMVIGIVGSSLMVVGTGLSTQMSKANISTNYETLATDLGENHIKFLKREILKHPETFPELNYYQVPISQIPPSWRRLEKKIRKNGQEITAVSELSCDATNCAIGKSTNKFSINIKTTVNNVTKKIRKDVFLATCEANFIGNIDNSKPAVNVINTPISAGEYVQVDNRICSGNNFTNHNFTDNSSNPACYFAAPGETLTLIRGQSLVSNDTYDRQFTYIENPGSNSLGVSVIRKNGIYGNPAVTSIFTASNIKQKQTVVHSFTKLSAASALPSKVMFIIVDNDAVSPQPRVKIAYNDTDAPVSSWFSLFKTVADDSVNGFDSVDSLNFNPTTSQLAIAGKKGADNVIKVVKLPFKEWALNNALNQNTIDNSLAAAPVITSSPGVIPASGSFEKPLLAEDGTMLVAPLLNGGVTNFYAVSLLPGNEINPVTNTFTPGGKNVASLGITTNNYNYVWYNPDLDRFFFTERTTNATWSNWSPKSWGHPPGSLITSQNGKVLIGKTGSGNAFRVQQYANISYWINGDLANQIFYNPNLRETYVVAANGANEKHVYTIKLSSIAPTTGITEPLISAIFNKTFKHLVYIKNDGSNLVYTYDPDSKKIVNTLMKANALAAGGNGSAVSFIGYASRSNTPDCSASNSLLFGSRNLLYGTGTSSNAPSASLFSNGLAFEDKTRYWVR